MAASPVLLVDDSHAQVAELRGVGEQCVGAHQHVHSALLQLRQYLLHRIAVGRTSDGSGTRQTGTARLPELSMPDEGVRRTDGSESFNQGATRPGATGPSKDHLGRCTAASLAL